MSEMSISATVLIEAAKGLQPTPNTRIVKTKGYGDEIMIRRYGLNTEWTGPNFNHVDFWVITGISNTGVYQMDQAAVTKFQRLGRREFEYLKSIQPNDFNDSGATLEQKMNWLIGEGKPRKRPYWTDGASWDGAWTGFEFGTMVFGHSRIRILTNSDGSPLITSLLCYVKDIDPLTGIVSYLEKNEDFVTVDGFTPEMMDYPLQWLIDNAYIQYATAANEGNQIDFYPRGNMLHPVWSSKVYPSNYGPSLFIPLFAIEVQ